MINNDLNDTSETLKTSVLNAVKTLCYEKKEFVLASGKTSDFYIDLRRISFDGEYLYLVGRLLYDEIKKIKDLKFSVIAGVPVGGIPLISSILTASFLDKNPLKSVVIRKEKKEYGKGNLIEPVQFLSKGANILIIEDVVTTGGSILKAVKNAREEGYEITDAVCVVDRQEGGAEFLKEKGIELHSLFTKKDIMQ
ncbi:MAG: orotate phosphoribosyltransferase [Deltaproteobacteria bacterium]|jgi:orotate phosphoribosyltransferase|nr:orotate phosphoribosyltransferase [Deltaproteobacteria bacterium]